MTETGSEVKNPSRRRFLRRSAGVGAGIVATALGIKYTADQILNNNDNPKVTGAPELSSTAETQETKVLTVDKETYKATFGTVETPRISGLELFPDGHSSFIKTDSGVSVFLSGGPHGYLLQGKDLQSLGQAQEILGPGSSESFDRNYAAPGSVINGINPGELLMFYHGENHPNAPVHFPFTAGIGLAISQDDGKTWEKKGQILKGMNEKPATNRVYGAGQPCAIVKDGYMYLYYIDWNAIHPDSIHLARSPLTANGKVGSWEKYLDGKFVDNGMDGESTPVITAPDGDYAALPGVSWNSFLNKFLAVYESKEGFNLTTSIDGITWNNKQRFLDMQTINNNPQNGQRWNSYPTLWSPDKKSDQETDNRMLLVYSEGNYNSTPHSMRMRPIHLSKT